MRDIHVAEGPFGSMSLTLDEKQWIELGAAVIAEKMHVSMQEAERIFQNMEREQQDEIIKDIVDDVLERAMENMEKSKEKGQEKEFESMF